MGQRDDTEGDGCTDISEGGDDLKLRCGLAFGGKVIEPKDDVNGFIFSGALIAPRQGKDAEKEED